MSHLFGYQFTVRSNGKSLWISSFHGWSRGSMCSCVRRKTAVTHSKSFCLRRLCKSTAPCLFAHQCIVASFLYGVAVLLMVLGKMICSLWVTNAVWAWNVDFSRGMLPLHQAKRPKNQNEIHLGVIRKLQRLYVYVSVLPVLCHKLS